MQYDRIRKNELLANDIDLAIVSIGKPEVGHALLEHLDISDGAEWIFCDPDNVLYDALNLNFNIFTPATAFAFRDRIFGTNDRKDGLGDLFEVLSKWKDAVYLPPKQKQAFNQGGTFIFKGANTVFAHYDASSGAHIPVNDAVATALKASK